MGRAHVYTTRLHVCTDVFGRVHGAYTAPYTGCVHGPVLVVHTAMYTTRIRPRTRVYVYKGRVRLHGRKRPSTRPYSKCEARQLVFGDYD